ncbi:MAG: hypothetical protein WCK67_00760 [bacterium]
MKLNKNLKFTNKIKDLGVKLKWFLFTEVQDYKITSDYIDFICPGMKKETDPVSELRAIVEDSLIREFSAEIKNTVYYELLVDSVIHKIQKQTLQNEVA